MGYLLPKYFTNPCVFSGVNSAWLSFGGSGIRTKVSLDYRIVAFRITCSNQGWLWAFFSQKEQCINHFGCVWSAVKSWKQNFVPLEQVFNSPVADGGTSQVFVQPCSSMGQKFLFLGEMQFPL